MTAESLFIAANSIALIGWILLVLLPGYGVLSRQVIPVAVCGLLGVLYLYLIVMHMGGVEGGFGSLDGIANLFGDKHLLLAGWVHYLAFDLFVGCWEVRDARRRGIAHLLVVPALLLTFMFGPTGLLAYFVIRFFRTKSLDLDGS